MEDQLNRDLAVFQQVCDANELNPKAISEEARRRFPDKFRDGENAEHLIWTALDHRASALINSVMRDNPDREQQRTSAAYTIDGDPAAPAFVINEEAIRSQYGADKAAKIIDVLSQVQLPVTG